MSSSAAWAIGARSPLAPDGAALAYDRRHAAVEHLDEGQRDLRAAAGVAVGVDVDPAGERGPDYLDRGGVADAGRVVVDQEALELADLLVVEHDLRELADPGVGAVHDLVGRELLLEHGPAGADPLERGGVELDGLVVTGNPNEPLDGQDEPSSTMDMEGFLERGRSTSSVDAEPRTS